MSLFIEGIEEKYPAALLEKRQSTEGMVVGCLFRDPTLIEDKEIPGTYFVTKDGLFYFNLIKSLSKAGISVIDDAAVITQMPHEIIKKYQDRGGYESVAHLQDISDLANFEGYYDDLVKSNLLMRIYKDGFNLFDAMSYNGKDVIPFNLFKMMRSEEVLDFYDTQLCSYDIGDQSEIIENQDLFFGPEWIEKLNKGEELVQHGTAYDVCGIAPDGSEVKTFSLLNSRTVGLHHGKLACVAAFSGTGKTTISANMILALVHQGEKVLIISNEDSAEDYRTRFLCIICKKFLKYDDITRDKFKRNNFTGADKDILKQAIEIFNAQYSPSIHFLRIAETNMRLILRKIKEFKLRFGFTAFWIDTLKLGEADFKNNRTDLAMVGNSRELANIAGKYDMIGICSLQLAERHRGTLSASSAQLSTAKQVKEILQQLFICRPLYNSMELDPNKKKTYCNPFILDTSKIPFREVPVSLDLNDTYIVVAIDKNRDGTCTPNDGVSYLYQFDGKHSTFEELCFVRTAQATLATGS